jgi:sodium-dependent dicarboxylate transporter 2/3/5
MTTSLRPKIGLVLGPVVFLLMLLAPAPEGLPPAAWRTAAVGALMAVWWMTEAIPIPATALLPLVLFPLLGIADIDAAAAPYANPIIYLFLGGFLLALALEASGLHRRVALATLALVGTKPASLVFGFMLITALLSMWVSNTATTVMMLPMALAVLALTERDGAHVGLESALLLGVAYAATIGGLGTLIGTPPNALFAAFMRESYGIEIGFAQWMLVTLPVIAVTLPLCWWLLTHVVHRLDTTPVAGGAELIAKERAAQGPMSRGEWLVGAVAMLAAVAWTTRPLLEQVIPAISDTGIAVFAALLLFLIPLRWQPLEFVINWKHAERLPWAVLLLFGGGLTLAAAIQGTGLSDWIGTRLALFGALPDLAMLALIVIVVVILSEFASNTAITAAFLPVVAALAGTTGRDPMLPALATAMAASAGFMLPVSTPPNAIVYGTGRITIGRMASAGGLLDLMFVMVIPVAVFVLGGLVFGGGR